MRRPEAFFREGRERYGLTFSADLAGLGRFVFLGEPSALRDVFLGDPDVLRTGEANSFVEHAVGPSSLLTLDGEAHARARRALIPPLHGERLDAHGKLIGALCEREIEGWQVGKPLKLEDACREITLQVILRVIFGLSAGAELEARAPGEGASVLLGPQQAALWAGLDPRHALEHEEPGEPGDASQ
jgi:cytochrome P450